MRLQAHAKVNLWLTVGARRTDGLHEVVSVMQSISLADEVEIGPAGTLAVVVDPAGAAPAGEDNLAARAARALASAAGVEPAARIAIAKRIPVAAGLAGGSADAAAALVGCNEMWGTALSRKALERIARALGSDVPFCVRGGTALAFGAGEQLAPLVAPRALWWVVAVPDAALPTAAVYARFDEAGGGPGAEEPQELADALARGDLAAVARLLRNDLAPAAESLEPSLAAAGARLLEGGALGATMSGSGPAWIGLARDEEHAQAVAAAVSGSFARVEVASSQGRGVRAAAP